MDLPVSVDDIERIEVLEGGASRVYGSSAFSGAINIVTRQSYDKTLGFNLSGGSFGTASAGAHLNLANQLNLYNRFSANYSRSDGGSANSDFNKISLFGSGGYSSPQLRIKWQGGVSSQNYGANTFYSATYNNQYEENRRYMLALSAELTGRIRFSPSVYWNRSLDHYLLFRDNPSAYENFHQLNVYGMNLNACIDWPFGKTAVGVEARNEGILSNSLGKPMEEKEYVKVPGHDAFYKNRDNRTNMSFFLEQDFLWEKVTVSLGLLANMNTALDHRFRLYPGIDMSWRFAKGWKMYASFNQALRMPTFTDLYYKSPTISGNVGLKPEKSTDYNIGVQYSSPAFQVKGKLFYRRGTDMIDWVKYHAEDTFHSANFDLDYYGVEGSAALDCVELWGAKSFLQRVNVSYAYIYQSRRDDQQIYSSNYALDYLKNKLVIGLNHRIVSKLSAQWDFRLQHRNGSFELYRDGKATGELTPYGTVALLDMKLQWEDKKFTVYLQGNNLTNHRYYDLGNVRQPGFWLMGGIKRMFAL
ncbi:MAG: TonB-dependent receptor [Bacteroidaceae bacterium]|nr:TonB-dependent receptor [Bacteroidaceae bacterium]